MVDEAAEAAWLERWSAHASTHARRSGQHPPEPRTPATMDEWFRASETTRVPLPASRGMKAELVAKPMPQVMASSLPCTGARRNTRRTDKDQLLEREWVAKPMPQVMASSLPCSNQNKFALQKKPLVSWWHSRA